MTNLPKNVVAFAGEDNKKVYEQFKDYYFHSRALAGKKIGEYEDTIKFAEKESRMHKALLSEVTRLGGEIPTGMDLFQFSSNPMLKWAMGTVVNMMIDSIIPDTIVKSVGLYADIKMVPYGASAQFTIKPNATMSVTKFSNGRREGFAQKQFNSTITIVPEAHNVTVSNSLYKILIGEDSLADFASKAVLAMETEMELDAYTTFAAIAERVGYPAALNVATFSADAIIEQCQIVETYSKAKPVIMGTKRALAKVLPDAASGYRLVTTAENPSIGLLRGFYDYDIMELAQVATGTDFGLALSDDYVYVVAPSSDKLVKGAIEGATQSFTINPEDATDLTTTTSFIKRWKFEVATNSVMGRIQVTS